MENKKDSRFELSAILNITKLFLDRRQFAAVFFLLIEEDIINSETDLHNLECDGNHF